MFNYYTIKTQLGENAIINTDDGTFVIAREENSDLYWNPIRKNYQEEDATYRITRENYYLFNIFNTLYEELIDCELFSEDGECLLTDGDIVNWHSDEDNEEANLLQMYKEENSIKIVFKKGKSNDYRIRIKNKDSKYSPANEAFMEMYEVLAYKNPKVNIEKRSPKVLKR